MNNGEWCLYLNIWKIIRNSEMTFDILTRELHSLNLPSEKNREKVDLNVFAVSCLYKHQSDEDPDLETNTLKGKLCA